MSSARGGGKFQATKSDLLSYLQLGFDSECECIWTKCQVKGKQPLILGTFYDPNGSIEAFEG